MLVQDTLSFYFVVAVVVVCNVGTLMKSDLNTAFMLLLCVS